MVFQRCEKPTYQPSLTPPQATRRLWAVVVAALAVVALLVTPSVGSASPIGVSGPPAAPSSGAWVGAHVNPRYGQDQLTSINRFQSDIGRPLAVVNKYHGFSDHNYRVEANLLATGRVPLISWRATDSGTDANRAAKIAAGTYDGNIRDTADAVKALGGGVLIRFNWEMDQPPGSRQYIGSPSEFIAAWRHIDSIFRARGVTNAAFVWAPRAGAWKKGTAAPFYPGGKYVDWIGGSAVPVNNFASFADLFGAFYSSTATMGKPLLTWVGMQEKPGYSRWKAKWMTAAGQTIQQMPKIKAYVYYHALSPKGDGFWADTTTQSMSAYKKVVCLPYFDTLGHCAG